MKTIRFFITTLFLSFFLISGLWAQPASCYVCMEDASGYTPTSEQLAALEAAACALIDSFPEAFRDSFRVYDFGFYLHQEVTEGGYPEPFAKKIQEVQDSTPYYLLFGKQTDKNGIYTRFWVELVLPDTGSFECIDLLSSTMRNDLTKKYQILTNQIYNSYEKIYFTVNKVEINVMDSLRYKLIEIVNCCDIQNKLRSSSCNTCVYSESQFIEFVSDYGLFKQNYIVLKKSNPLSNDPDKINRIIYDNQEELDVDIEIGKVINEYQQSNPESSIKVFIFSYPEDCTNFDQIYNEYANDDSNSKLLIGLIGSIGGPGSICWQSSGTIPIYRDSKDIGYTWKKKEDGSFYVNLEINLQVINLSKQNSLSPETLRSYISNHAGQTFNGDFKYYYNRRWIINSGSMKINTSIANNKSELKPNKHIIAIVDDIPFSAGEKLNPAGLSNKLDGVVACIEAKYSDNKTIGLHEIGHLLGLNDDYINNTIMGDLDHATWNSSANQKSTIYNRFLDEKVRSGKWRTHAKYDSPNSITELKLFLNKENINYDKNKF